MNKLFISAVAAAALLASTAPVALAATVTSDFTVSVQLAGQCQALNTGTQTVDFGTYTAFGAAKMLSPTVDMWSEGKELIFGFSLVAIIALSFIAAVRLTRRPVTV